MILYKFLFSDKINNVEFESYKKYFIDDKIEINKNLDKDKIKKILNTDINELNKNSKNIIFEVKSINTYKTPEEETIINIFRKSNITIENIKVSITYILS